MAVHGKIYVYLDGVEYDPFPEFTIGWTTTGNSYGGYALAIGSNDSALVRPVDTYLDDVKIGTSGYGSIDVFTDDFSSGFAPWDALAGGGHHIGVGPWLSISGGQLHLQFNTDYASTDCGGSVFSDASNVYFLYRAKCNNPLHTNPASPAYQLIGASGGDCWINYYSDGINFRGEGSTGAFPGTYSSTNYFVAATMNDGNWHDVGIRFQIIDTVVAYHLEGAQPAFHWQ